MKAGALRVEVVRGLDRWLAALAIRAIVYIGEQDYSIGEEFDGADLAGATHLLALEGEEPVGACRIRWYADFAKLERVAVKRAQRSGRVTRALWRAGAELASRKGYRLMLGHIERRLLPFWERAAGFRARANRASYWLNQREFLEAIAELPPHPEAICLNSPAAILLEGDADYASPQPMLRAS